MAQIICPANSNKHQGRCIAGIDIKANKWVRPIIQGKTAIYEERFIDGKGNNEPQLLDLIEIPLGSLAPDEGCQPENYYAIKGLWRRINHLSINDISKYIENTSQLLHNQDKKVDPEIFGTMLRSQWKSLQLIEVIDAKFYSKQWEKTNYYCIFTYSGIQYDLKLTDPLAIHKVESKHPFTGRCLLSISMATPWKTPAYDKPYCWKMVAGVIELQ